MTLELTFSQLVLVSSVKVYETYSAPFVTSVLLYGPDGSTTIAYSGTDTTGCGQALDVPVSRDEEARETSTDSLARSTSKAPRDADAVRATRAREGRGRIAVVARARGVDIARVRVRRDASTRCAWTID